MTTTTNVKQVKMNIMTQAQYDAITPVETELYAITDAELVTIDSALSASSENPVQNKVVYTALNGKQDTLVSGTNIKTINSTTLLGSGNVSVQPTIDSNNKLSSDLVDDTNNTHKFATSAQLTQIGTNQSNISTINGKIPSQASTTNQLADKAFVNSSVQTATANFRGNWSTWANVPTSASSYPADYAGSTTPTVNDYMVVQDASDYTGETLEGTWRFKYTGTWSTDGKAGWNPEYQVNETPLTSAQLAALNSGITSSDVALIGTALQPNDNISELTNDSGYITGISSSDVTTALGYTPYNATNPSGYISGITSSDVTTALGYTPQVELTSGTNIKTVNNNSLLGSGNITIDSLPSQSGQSGKFLTTNGTTASWSTVSIPTVDQTFDGTSTNAQSGVAIEGELANYVRGQNGNIMISNNGTEATIMYVYEEEGTPQQGYVISLGETSSGDGVIFVSANIAEQKGYMAGLVPEGFSIENMITSQSAVLTVSNSNLAVNGTEVALSTDIPDISTKQDTLVSGTNIKTINNNSLLGSGNITIDSLPSQSGQSGKYLTTNGTTASWSTISMPTVDQTFNSSSANAQSGVAIAGELTNYLQASNGNVTFTNDGTAGGVVYQDSDTGELYGTFIGYTPFGNGVMMGAVDPNGYLLGVTSSGINILKGTAASPTNGIALTVTNNNTLAIGGDEVATQTWVGNQGYITSAALSTLTDVALSSPTQGQNLTYDATLGKWKNTSTTATVAWGGITGTLADQTDLNTALGGKQATLVSGTNIKTINSTSLLGSGDIAVLQNTATGTNSLTLLGTATTQTGSINIGYGSSVTNSDSVVIGESAQSAYAQTVAIGYQANANDTSSTAVGYKAYTNYQQASAYGYDAQATAAGTTAIGSNSRAVVTQANAFGFSAKANKYGSTAVGYNAVAGANYAIQIGNGTNSTASTLAVGFNGTNYQLLDGTTGLIPDARISSNIARTSAIPTVPTNISAFTNDAGYLTSVPSGYATQSWVGQQGYLTSASLSTLTDVALSSPTQGQNLTYDATTGKWKNTSTTATVAWGGITGTLADQTDLNTALSGKQATLVSGTNIKTINSTSLLGSGNIEVLQNTATGTNSLTLLGTATSSNTAINIGYNSSTTTGGTVAIGTNASTSGTASISIGANTESSGIETIAIGDTAKATANNAIQIGYGTNNTANKFKVRSHELLDLATGLIPDARISSNIARTSDIPSITVDQTYDSTSANAQSGVAIAGAGFLTSSDLTNYVTTDTDQNITGTKTFVGQKKIGFKQSSSSDKLGFTLYNNSGTEKGYLEYNPSNTVDSVPLMTLGNYATASGGLTHVGFRKYSSISGASGAYNLLAPLISDAKTPFSLTTTYTNFYLPLGFTDGTTTVKTAKSGMVDISSLLPTVGDGTITINQGGTQKGTFTVNQSGNTTINLDAGGGTVDQTYDGTSTNAQSGVAIAGELVNYVPTSYGNIGFDYDGTTISGGSHWRYNDSTEDYGIEIDTEGHIFISYKYNSNETANIGLSSNYIGLLAADIIVGNYNNSVGLTVSNSNKLLVDNEPIATEDWVTDQEYATETWVGQQGYITGITSSDVTTALGYTPQTQLVSGTNIKTINSTSLLGSGDISVLQNTATGSGALTIDGTPSDKIGAINIGSSSQASQLFAIALGAGAQANGSHSISIGNTAVASAQHAIQIGNGTNSTQYTLQVGFTNSGNYQLLDGITGLIPDARISTNIARTSALDSKVNTSDIWYDSTSKTLYIGVAQS